MALASSDKCLASFRLMDALNEVQFFQLLQRAVDRHQPEVRRPPARRVIDLDRGERPRAVSDGLDDRSPRLGQSVAILIELGKPHFSSHWS